MILISLSLVESLISWEWNYQLTLAFDFILYGGIACITDYWFCTIGFRNKRANFEKQNLNSNFYEGIIFIFKNAIFYNFYLESYVKLKKDVF